MLAPALVAQVAVPAFTVRSAAASASASRAAGVTFSQFEQAAQIAKLAADHGMTELSLRAMTQALHGGPPLEAMQEIDQNNPFGQRQQVNENSQAVIKVQQQLAALEPAWRQKGVTDDAIYALLRGAVLPESRPIEVFLYPQPLASSPGQQPQSVGALLVNAAVKAKKTDDLKAGLESRLKQPLGELSARIILAQLAMATRDTAAAKEQLTALGERLKQDSLQHTSELACHVALPAMTLDELPPVAVGLIEKAVQHFHKGIQSGQTRGQIEPSKSLTYKLAQHYFRSGNAEAGKKLLEGWITLQGQLWSNYGGDYPAYQRKLALLSVAGEYGRAGLQGESLDMLGRFADAVTSRDYQVGGPGRDGVAILNGLAVMQPSERYALLKSWSLPTKDRQSVRVVASLIPGDDTPSGFDAVRGATPRGPRHTQFVGSADLLVAAATATGKLAELQGELKPLAEKNVENAKFLWLLSRVANPDDAQIAADLRTDLAAQQKADAEAEKANSSNSRRQRPDLTNAILAQAAIARAATRDAGLALSTHQFTRWSKFQDHLHMTAMRHLYNAGVLGAARATDMDNAPHEVGLAHWTGGAFAAGDYRAGGAVPAWWLTHEGMIQHICGPDQSYLFFNYPLTGSFEFSCEAWLGSWGEGNASYGGLMVDALNLGAATRLYPIGNRADVFTKVDPLDKRDRFNKVTIRVAPRHARFYVNGSLLHEESLPAEQTSPWLVLQCDRVWQTAFKDLRITGSPVIPREVKLSGGSSLLGWTARFYNETTATHWAKKTPEATDQEQPAAPVEPDWWSEDGVIRGRRVAASTLGQPTPLQSRLHYCRPLLSGETLRYEFWYEPGAAALHVHPALDRLAMILDPSGVKLHWMTDSNDAASSAMALGVDNLIEDKTGRRGNGPLPLKAKDWNAVELRLTGDRASLSLNGTEVHELKLDAGNDRQFGFFHDKHASEVRVRNVVLTGDWPKSLTPEIASNLIAPSRPPTAEERRQLARTFDEKYAAASLDAVILNSRALPPEQRFAALAEWVLPNDDHAALRLYATFAPADVVASSPLAQSISAERGTGSAEQKRDDNSSPASQSAVLNPQSAIRHRPGGELLSPAIDLIATAIKLGKLDEVEQRIHAVEDSSPLIARQKKSFLGLVALAKSDIKQASAQLKALTPTRPATLDDTLTMDQRWPEWLLLWEAARVPALRPEAKTLVEFLIDSINRKGIGGEWEAYVRRARHQVDQLLAGAESIPRGATTSPKGQWSQVTFATADARASGQIPVWRFHGHEAAHLGGQGNDLIYFQSPLRGKFTIEAEVSSFGWREVRPMYNTLWAAPNYTHEQIDSGNLLTNWNAGKITPKLDPLGDWYVTKVEVEPGKVSFSANGRKFHESPLPQTPDPWFALHSWGHYGGGVRSVRITGQPEIPAEINITAQPDLNGWWPGMYGDVVTGDNPVWKRSGDEIVARKYDNEQSRARQSILVYHRPLLEDGEIAYDFFHVPGQTHVHPALGRAAFLLEPEGVTLHWLTDAQHERTGLAPDNATVEKACRRGPDKLPLKSGDWNRLALAVKGETLTLTLNGTVIYERPVEPENQRQFGLFRYGGLTDVRVKNVTYRGDWPKTLPTLKEQELNPGPFTRANFADGELITLLDWDCSTPKPAAIEAFGAGGKTTLVPTDKGLLITRPAGEAKAQQVVGHIFRGKLSGDFEITLDFADFQSTTKPHDWMLPRVEVNALLGGGHSPPKAKTIVALNMRRPSPERMEIQQGQMTLNDKGTHDWSGSQAPTEFNGGRLRIVRKGGTSFLLHAASGTDDWQLITTRAVDKNYVHEISVTVRAEDMDSTFSCLFQRITVRGQFEGASPALAGAKVSELHWNGEGPQPPWLQKWAGELPNKFEPVGGGIKITRPQDPKQKTAPVGFNWIGTLKGDFEATLSYRDFESTTDRTDHTCPRVELHIPIGGVNDSPQNTHTVAAGHRRVADGKELLTGGVGELQPDGKKAWKTDQAATKRTAGRLRVIRQGSMIHYLTAEAGSDNFVVNGSRPASAAEVKSMSFTLRSESKASAASITFTEISIRAVSLETNLAAMVEAPKVTVASATFGEKALPARLEWNFHGERPAFLKLNKFDSPNRVEEIDKGLKLSRAAAVVKGNDQVAFQWNGLIQGDFEITADYRDYVSKSAGTDWKVPRVELGVYLHSTADPANSSYIASVYHERRGNGEAVLGQLGTRGADGQYAYKSDSQPDVRSTGRLRLSRKGSRLFFLTAPTADSNDWQLITHRDLGNEDLRQLILTLRSDDLAAEATATLTNLVIRADKLQGAK